MSFQWCRLSECNHQTLVQSNSHEGNGGQDTMNDRFKCAAKTTRTPMRILCIFTLIIPILQFAAAGCVRAADMGSKPDHATVSCTRNYRDLYGVEVKLNLKGGELQGLRWETTTDKGHTCGVSHGTLRDPSATKEAFYLTFDMAGDWYLIDPENQYCVVHIQRFPDGFALREAFPGSCKAYCGANGRFETTVVRSHSSECGLPRLEERDKVVK